MKSFDLILHYLPLTLLKRFYYLPLPSQLHILIIIIIIIYY